MHLTKELYRSIILLAWGGGGGGIVLLFSPLFDYLFYIKIASDSTLLLSLLMQYTHLQKAKVIYISSTDIDMMSYIYIQPDTHTFKHRYDI